MPLIYMFLRVWWIFRFYTE